MKRDSVLLRQSVSRSPLNSSSSLLWRERLLFMRAEAACFQLPLKRFIVSKKEMRRVGGETHRKKWNSKWGLTGKRDFEIDLLREIELEIRKVGCWREEVARQKRLGEGRRKDWSGGKTKKKERNKDDAAVREKVAALSSCWLFLKHPGTLLIWGRMELS